MKRISTVLFLSLASVTALEGQVLNAQSADRNVAPGPIAEVIPEFDLPNAGEIDLPGSNPLPPANRTDSPPPADNPLPLFDTPARGTSGDALIVTPPPSMPSGNWEAPPTPGRAISKAGSATTSADGSATKKMPAATEAASVPGNGPQAHVQEGCGCGACQSADAGVCDDCQSAVACDTCETSVCGTDQFISSEHDFYDTGADRIDGQSSRRKTQHGKKTQRRSWHKGFLSRHFGRKKDKQQTSADHLPVEDEANFAEVQYIEQGHGDALSYNDFSDELHLGDHQVVQTTPAADYQKSELQVSDQPNRKRVNTLIGVSGLYFTRNYEDNQAFSASRFPGERGLFSNDADHEEFGGFDVNLARRKANGNGFEIRYFGLEPSQASSVLDGNPQTLLAAASPTDPPVFLSGVGILGSPSVTAAEIFNLADVHEVSRDTSIHNVEVNLLRLGRTSRRRNRQDRTVSHEYLAGFRYLQFDESFNYSARSFQAGTIASGLSRAQFLSEVSNNLYGAQIGGRTEIGFLNKFSLIVGTKAGIFSNRFSNDQNVSFFPRGASPVTAQVLNGPSQGQPFDTSGEDTELTMVGELDLGVTYQMFRNSRLRIGYRALFVSDVALAVPQTEMLFSDLQAVSEPSADDDLILHGGYFGLEVAY